MVLMTGIVLQKYQKCIFFICIKYNRNSIDFPGHWENKLGARYVADTI